MRNEAIQLEEQRLREVNELADYPAFHERHRIFPSVFEGRQLSRVIDLAGGVGVVGKRIKDHCSAELLCNDICPKALKTMEKSGLKTVSFDIDDKDKSFPFEDGHFDAVIALATIEHLINIDHFMQEIHRVLRDEGYLYLSAPNYAGLTYLLPFLITGKTFHNPLTEPSRYEFYAHVRYFTYQTLIEYGSSHNFTPDTVYLPLPETGSRYLSMRSKSQFMALAFRNILRVMYHLSPRWSAEPVICFQKQKTKTDTKLKVVIM
jgi:SAM-dependent methyltransferase